MSLKLAKGADLLAVHKNLVSIIDILRHQDCECAVAGGAINADPIPGVANVALIPVRLPTRLWGSLKGIGQGWRCTNGIDRVGFPLRVARTRKCRGVVVRLYREGPAPSSMRGCRRPGCRCSCPGHRSGDGCSQPCWLRPQMRFCSPGVQCVTGSDKWPLFR